MRKRIVKVPQEFFYNDDVEIDRQRDCFRKIGIDPLFVSNKCEILEPDKKRKKCRPVRKKRSKNFSTLESRRIERSVEWLRGDLGL